MQDKKRFAIEARRSAASALGAASQLLQNNGEIIAFDSYEAAAAEARRITNIIRSKNLTYRAVVLETEGGQ